jgi:hypothetical protein
MKKIALSLAVIATVAMAGGDIVAVTPTVEATEVKTTNSFLDRVHFKGDLRLRYESFERDDSDNKYSN